MTFSDVKGELREFPCTVSPDENIPIYARSDTFSSGHWIWYISPNSPFKGIKNRVLLTPLISTGKKGVRGVKKRWTSWTWWSI